MQKDYNRPLLPSACVPPENALIPLSDYGKTWDFYPEKKIEFMCKGFSHLQPLYEKIKKIAVMDRRFPIGTNNHRVYLQKEPQNEYDTAAIAVHLQFPEGDHKLGYIPKWLTQYIHTEWDRIGSGYIYQMVNTAGSFIACRVVIGYDGYKIEDLEDVEVNGRFDDLLDEGTLYVPTLKI